MSKFARTRSCNDQFDAYEMEHRLSVLAGMKHPGFDWSFAEYDKAGRNSGPDRAGIERYARVLRIILEMCPSGLPAK